MQLRHIAILAAAAALLSIAGCPPGKAPGPAAGQTPRSGAPAGSSTVQKVGSLELDLIPAYLQHLKKYDYHDTDQAAKDAWFLVETAYLVVEQKYLDANKLAASANPQEKAKGMQLKDQVSTEIDRNIFGINPKVEALFKKAIDNQPKNPLNHATYAVYLKARKRFTADGASYKNAEPEAIAEIDKAIALWPEEPTFYLIKISILTDPYFCYTWYRTVAGEELALQARLPDVRKLFDKAEELWPKNSYVNYQRALLVTRLTPPEEFSKVRDEVLDQIRKGNKKPEGAFYFPPPLSPVFEYGQMPRLKAKYKSAIYIDFWTEFGHFEPSVVADMIVKLQQGMTWPKDKADAGQVMFMLYNLSRVLPKDHSLLSLQLQILQPFSEKAKADSPEQKQLSEVLRFLNDQYISVARELYNEGLLREATKLDVVGVAEMETRFPRNTMIIDLCQGREAAYLKRAGEILGLKFDLPEDPSKW